VETVEIDLRSLDVSVVGAASDEAVRTAIEEAGYEVTGARQGNQPKSSSRWARPPA
jgi:copper chaperone CopZ